MSGAVSRALRAYPTLLRIGLAEAVAYRAEMIVWLFSSTMPLVSLSLWAAVANVAPVGRFDAHGFSAYFLATLLVRQLTGSWLVWELNTEIRSGALSRRLLKPIHPLVAYSAENLAALPMRALLSAPIAVLALWVVGRGALPHDAATLALFGLSIVGAWLINFLVMALIGAIAFFVESSTAIFDLWLVAFMILSGYLIPLELLPPGLRAVTHALPFRYTMAFPVETLTGLLDWAAALHDLRVQWTYVAGCGAAALLAWRLGLRRFAAFGG